MKKREKYTLTPHFVSVKRKYNFKGGFNPKTRGKVHKNKCCTVSPDGLELTEEECTYRTFHITFGPVFKKN